MVSRSSVAGFMPRITSPQPYASPSRVDSRISSSSSPGLFGWIRDPKCRGDPIVMPSPGNGLKIPRPTRQSSALVMTFAAAAIASLERP